jgi:tRNA(Ile)-lysidine synthase
MVSKFEVARAVKATGLLAAGDRIIMAVSGGPDSVALLYALCDLRQELNLHLEVAHLQHGVRGQDAEADARFVQALAETLELPFHLKEVDIPRLRLQAGKGNLEAIGRRERYAFFAQLARHHHLNKIATAHTADDQAETVLMWLLRGTGRRGLGAMAPIQKVDFDRDNGSGAVSLIRPLLGVSKEALLRFLHDRGLRYCTDVTNTDTHYQRNWIRTDLLPRLKAQTDTALIARLAHLAEIARDEDMLLDEIAQRELESSQSEAALCRDQYLVRPKALQRRMLRLWIERTRGHLRGVDFMHIEALHRLICDGPPQGRLSLPGGWEMTREYNALRLARRARLVKTPCFSYPVIIGGVTRVPEAGMIIECRVFQPTLELPSDHWEVFFDRNALGQSLVLRNFRNGDRIQPLGMAGHKKVKDLFIEKRMPVTERARLPLLVMGEEVLWVPGHARSAIGRLGPGAREALRIRAMPVAI